MSFDEFMENDEERITVAVDWLRNQTHWSGFAQSVVSQYDERGYLSDKQVEAIYSMMAKSLNRPVRCRRCRQWLTDPKSIDRGIGPICEQYEIDGW